MNKMTNGEKVFNVANIMLLTMLSIITLYPMYYVVVCSFSDGLELMRTPGVILAPIKFNIDAYKSVLSNPRIFSGYGVTLFVVCVGTTINIILTSIAAFLITRKKFAIKKPLTYLMLFTMYFSGGMIPTYLVVNNWIGLENNLFALILPGAISVYNMLIMKTNFSSIPQSLEEAALIDGAKDFTILFKIILPLSKSIIAVMALFYGVEHWNSWFKAMLYIKDRSMQPLQSVLREILLISQNNKTMMGEGVLAADNEIAIGESIKYATIVVATFPILCVYPFIQRYFVKGVMIGAVKG